MLFVIQVVPEFVEVYIGTLTPKPGAAIILVPSAEQATDCQPALGTLFVLQVSPEFVEMYIRPT